MNPNGAAIVFLHAIARTPRSFHKMQKVAEAGGFQTLNVGYPSRTKTLEVLAEDIHSQIEHFCRQGAGPVHFVGHSMGGLLARVYLSKYKPARLGRAVFLGTPNGGSEIADLLGRFSMYRSLFGPAGLQLGTAYSREQLQPRYPVTYPLGIIAGNRSIDPVSSTFLLPKPNDGRVSVENTRIDGMTGHIVIASSHAFLASNNEAIRQTLAFLRDGKFIG